MLNSFSNGQNNGQCMLLIGNSFFKPYANHLDDVAAEAGYTEHTARCLNASRYSKHLDSWEEEEIQNIVKYIPV